MRLSTLTAPSGLEDWMDWKERTSPRVYITPSKLLLTRCLLQSHQQISPFGIQACLKDTIFGAVVAPHEQYDILSLRLTTT